MTAGVGSFAGKVAVVTGSTQGIGEAVALLLAERGAAGVVICGRRAEMGLRVAELLAQKGARAEFVPADLSRVEDCFSVIDAAERAFGRIDVLANCAGSSERGGIDDTTPDLWDRLFALNVRAPFFLIQRAVRLMRRHAIQGSIVNIISVSSHGGQPFLTPYSASKGALATLTRNLAYALQPDRIRVNGLNLGWTDTPGEHVVQTGHHGLGDDWLKDVEARQPFGRLLKPMDVARAVAFLASDESAIMTGAIVDFDQNVVGCGGRGEEAGDTVGAPART